MTKEFPIVEGSNLEGRRFTLPEDLEGQLNIVFIPVKRYQQLIVEGWIPFIEKLTNIYPKLEFYEVSSLAKGYMLTRFLIDGGMRVGFPSKKARERTIILHVSNNDIKENLEIRDENTIYLFLLTENGKIIFREEGAITSEKAKRLEQIIRENLN
ncbi:MAG: hypothetical protein ACFFCQ_10245 [Promethearchaeota archaeon]